MFPQIRRYAMRDSWMMVEKNPPQKVSHKDKNHFYGSDSTRNGGYALTPMPWTGPAPRTRTGRGLQDLSPPTYVVQGQPTVCASSRRSQMCFAFSTHWLRSALASGPSSIPSVAKVFNRVWGSKVCSPRVGNVLAVAPINLSPSSAYRIDLKKILRPGKY